ncbi:MAG: gluconate 2-dehydrogenase subunit 3 family protein [Marinoscillum sp.]
MERRKAIISMSLSTAGLGLSSSFISLLSGCTSKPKMDYEPLTFSANQDLMVQTLVERIIPTTDTPGARQAGVHQFIDKVLAMVKETDEKIIFLDGLEALNVASRSTYGSDFVELSESDQIAQLQHLENQSEDSSVPSFFQLLKSMTIYGYYTSEIGASQELSYVHATGVYDGNYPYSKVGKNYY